MHKEEVKRQAENSDYERKDSRKGEEREGLFASKPSEAHQCKLKQLQRRTQGNDRRYREARNRRSSIQTKTQTQMIIYTLKSPLLSIIQSQLIGLLPSLFIELSMSDPTEL